MTFYDVYEMAEQLTPLVLSMSDIVGMPNREYRLLKDNLCFDIEYRPYSRQYIINWLPQ